LALDNPEQIKKQFGVGYKLLIEPKTEVIKGMDFVNLKRTEIDPILQRPEYKSKGIIENSDSTVRKVIY